MKPFGEWFAELKENTLFFDRMCLKHSGKNLNLVAQNVYDWLVAKEEQKDIQGCRVLFDRFAASHPKDAMNVVKSPVEENKKEEPQPVPRESKEYMEWTNKALAEIAKSKTINYFPGKSYSERAEEGGVRRPKDKPYPGTTAAEAYVRQRHLEWIKYAFEPRTGQRLPDTVDEDEFNIQYDNNLL